jgi:Na+/glutamate symporter
MNFSTQIRELAIAYGLTAAAMLTGLLLMRADRRAYFRWPVYSVMAMALGVVLWNLLRKHLLPEEWVITHANVLYYGALGVYVTIGFAFGLLLGRLTGRKNAPESKSEPRME